MNRLELEHVIRAACDILGVEEVIIVGSQAILGQHADAPKDLRQSPEADVFAEGLPQAKIDSLNVIGFGSPFHETHGYYVDPVGPATALLPPGWRERAFRVDTTDGAATGWCPEAHDLAISKLARSDPRDLEYVGNLLFHRLVRPSRLQALINTLDVGDAMLAHLHRGLEIAQRHARERRASSES